MLPFTSFSKRAGPPWTTVGSCDFTDVDEVGLSIQLLEAAVDGVQALLVSQLARNRSEVFESRWLSRPGYTRSWEDVSDGALHLLVAAQP